MLAKLCDYCLDVPYKNTGIPIEMSVVKVVLGCFPIGLLLEGNYLGDAFDYGSFHGLNIAVAGFGPVGLDADGDNGVSLLRKGESQTDAPLEFGGVNDQGIGRSHYNIGLGVLFFYLPAGVGNARGRVAGCGFGQYVFFGNLGQMLFYYLYIVLVGYYPDMFLRTETLETFDCHLDKTFTHAHDIDKLLGIVRGAERPETAANAAGHDDKMCIV